MELKQLESSKALAKAQGEVGEEFALAYERKRLPSFLHDRIVYLGEHEVAMGYDILSFETKDDLVPERCIEVKTFRGHPHFHWTDNEIAAAKNNAEHYYLYLVDYDRIDEPNYEPTIIPNPAALFNEDSQWSYQVQQYVFTLKSNEHIPDDWDESTILLGCYNNEKHLRWILSHNIYNVRSQKNAPGAVDYKNHFVWQPKYLLLYSIANPLVYMLYSLEIPPKSVTKTEMQALSYPEPHAYYYIIYHITKQLDGFYIDLRSILREVNHTKDRTPGTPVYLNGTQLRRFMAAAEKQPTLENAGTPWTPEQEQELTDLFNARVSFQKISDKMQRTVNAIMSRLILLGLINKKDN